MSSKIFIHPVIAIRSEYHQKEESEIPICCKLQPEDEECPTCPTEKGTLQQLRNFLRDTIEKENKQGASPFGFSLDEEHQSYLKTLHSIEDQWNLSEFEKVVICCPFHYLECESACSSVRDLKKLIFGFEIREIYDHPQLEPFYSTHMDDPVRQKKNIRMYKKIDTVAFMWLDEMKKIYTVDRPASVKKALTEMGGYS